MKKALLALPLAAALCAPASQAAAHTQEQLKQQQDSISIVMGQLYGSSLARTFQSGQASMADFERAFDLMMSADTANMGYMNGLGLGMEYLAQQNRLKQGQNIELNKEAFVAALKSAMAGTEPVSDQALNELNTNLQERIRATEELATELAPATVAARQAGADYVAQMLKQGYKQTASGLVYKMVKKGTGANFAATDDIRLTYKGTHVDGSQFDASADTTTMNPGRVVAGFREALLMMSPGAQMIAVIPSELAYGFKGAGKDRRTGKYAVSPGETIVFEISTFGTAGNPAAPKAATQPATAGNSAQPKGRSGVRAKNGKGPTPVGGKKY